MILHILKSNNIVYPKSYFVYLVCSFLQLNWNELREQSNTTFNPSLFNLNFQPFPSWLHFNPSLQPFHFNPSLHGFTSTLPFMASLQPFTSTLSTLLNPSQSFTSTISIFSSGPIVCYII